MIPTRQSQMDFCFGIFDLSDTQYDFVFVFFNKTLYSLLFITVLNGFMNFSVCSRIQLIQEKSIHVEMVFFQLSLHLKQTYTLVFLSTIASFW